MCLLFGVSRRYLGVTSGSEICSYAGVFDVRLYPTYIGRVGACQVVWHDVSLQVNTNVIHVVGHSNSSLHCAFACVYLLCVYIAKQRCSCLRVAVLLLTQSLSLSLVLTELQRRAHKTALFAFSTKQQLSSFRCHQALKQEHLLHSKT